MISYAKVFLAVCFWGISFSFTKKALDQTTPELLVFLRCVLGALTLLFFAKSFKIVKTLKLKHWGRLLFISFLGIAGHKLLQAYALKYTSANHAGWLIGAIPLIVVFVMVAFFKEKISKLRGLGFVFGFTGISIILLSKQTDLKGALIPTEFGDFLFILTCFTWAFYTVLVKRWFKNFKMLDITVLSMALACLISAVFVFTGKDIGKICLINFEGWISILYLGVFCSGIAFVLWNDGVDKLGPTAVSSFLYLEPFPAVAAGVIMLGEKISVLAFFGGTLILAGVYWINGGRRGVGFLKKFYSWFEEG